VPYKPTGKPNGRPPKQRSIAEHERLAARLRASARRHEDQADRLIVKALASRTRKQLASGLGVSTGFIYNAVRRYKRRELRK
jgi:hypothetical protein